MNNPRAFFVQNTWRCPKQSARFTIPPTAFDGETYLVTIDCQAATDLMLVGYTPLGRVYQPLQRYQPLFWVFTAAVVLLAVLFFVLLFRLLHQPLRQFAAAFRHVEQGRFDLQADASASRRVSRLVYRFQRHGSQAAPAG
jgi:nitrogen fixation/metabolism regulation signal transduction histidine kinase